jgi:hypothetical protein
MAAVAALSAPSVSALAQIAQPPAAGTTRCAPSVSGPAPAMPRDDATGAAPSQNLSDTLARSEGVICPPANLDPAMRAPTPDAGNTPVIPPPGSPGGDPSVRPK